MIDLHFDFRDVFRAGRYGFSGKKISLHLLGLAFAYLIYEILVYASLLISGGTSARDFWNTYALLPVWPLADYDFQIITIVAMWIGVFILFVIFFLTSMMVSKITIQQLRGDHFFSMKESLGFAKQHWKAVFGVLISLTIIFLLLAAIPISVGLLGKIPAVGPIIVMLASALTLFAFLIGLFLSYLFVILGISLFLTPAVVATTSADTFEVAYQHFSIVWNQPWRAVIYETLLFFVKLLCVPIWAVFCLAGFVLAMLPIRLLLPTDMKIFMGYVDQWLGRGRAVAKLGELPYVDKLLVFDTVAPADLRVDQISVFHLYSIKITSFFMTASVILIAGVIIAYLLSIASVGNTLIYTVLRKQTDDENLLEADEEEFADQIGVEESAPQTEETSENLSDSEERSE